jgi:hypothetical protein
MPPKVVDDLVLLDSVSEDASETSWIRTSTPELATPVLWLLSGAFLG